MIKKIITTLTHIPFVRDHPLIFQLPAGMLCYIPGIRNIIMKGTGGSNSSRYCYSVFLRHLVCAYQNGLSEFPQKIGELGPGDSLGIGLSALIAGTGHYHAFDVVNHSTIEQNLIIFNELVELFNRKEPIPDDIEFPRIQPSLKEYSFPHHILTDDHLTYALHSERIQSIRNIFLGDKRTEKQKIVYSNNMNEVENLEKGTFDLILSQAVLEHIDDPTATYHSIHHLLRLGGAISHEIDFKCHRTARLWNGHWAYSDKLWRIVKGGRPYLINRYPYSKHLLLMKNAGFKIIYQKTIKDYSGIQRNDLALEWKDMSDDDLHTASAFIQAIKI